MDRTWPWGALGLRLAEDLGGARLLGEAVADRPGAPLRWAPERWPAPQSLGDLLHLRDPLGRWVALPQVVLVHAWPPPDEGAVGLRRAEGPPPPLRLAPEALAAHQAAARPGARLYDGASAGLTGWDAEARLLTWTRRGYFDYLCTNLAMDAARGDETPREAQGRRGLPPLGETGLADAVGVSGLVFTADDQMILQRRAPDLAVRPGCLCGGFSGMVDWRDLTGLHGARLADLDVLRELEEELGVRREEVRARAWLGLTRELARGGAPELFYAANLRLSAAEVLARAPSDPDGARLAVPVGDRDFWGLLEAVVAAGAAPVSVPLLTNLALWWGGRGSPDLRVGPRAATALPE